MTRYRLTLNLIAAMLLITEPAAATDPAVDAGRRLYQDSCQRCHGQTPKLGIKAAELAAFMRTGSVSRHRFTLTEQELAQLTAYLESLESG